MEKKEWYTIKEFAEAAGVSPQSVYKRLNGVLEPYLSIRNGRKCLNIKALSLYEEENDDDNKFNKNNQPSTGNNQLIQLLKDELEAKNKQIDKLHMLLEQSNANLAQAQYRLQLIEELQNQESEDKEPEEVAVVADQKKEVEQKKSWWQKLFNILKEEK